jgi:predicted O-methyltransferase YrrM
LYGEYERRRSLPSDIQDHLPELYHWARGWPFAHIVELGTRTGVSTSALLAGVEADRRGHVWSYDLDPADVPEAFAASGYWTFCQRDALSPAAVDTAPREVEVLFIDLDPHSFEQTLAALMMWAPLVRPGGVILCHDTEWPEIRNVTAGSAESEVGRALDAFCKMRGHEWRNRHGCNGLGVLRIR